MTRPEYVGIDPVDIKLAPPRDPEYKGLVERNNQFLETSFLPGRQFASQPGFSQQLAEWLDRANTRTVHSIQGRPLDLPETARPSPVRPGAGPAHCCTPGLLRLALGAAGPLGPVPGAACGKRHPLTADLLAAEAVGRAVRCRRWVPGRAGSGGAVR
ncbi:hypothetical protein [Kitasatospora sp. NPDC059571]|uniref:hypothetical protein n=1 Tax=Kitasatospora sp. NPDC059571 TaxID=3346871 RepID=UPI0036A1CB25